MDTPTHFIRTFARDIRPGRYSIAWNATAISRPQHAGLTYREAVRVATDGLDPGSAVTIYRGRRPITTLVRNGNGSLHSLDHATGRVDGQPGFLLALGSHTDLDLNVYEALPGTLETAVTAAGPLLADHAHATTAFLLQHMRTLPNLPAFFRVNAYYGAGEWVVTHHVQRNGKDAVNVTDLVEEFHQLPAPDFRSPVTRTPRTL